jgi:hypothetical protein
MSFPPKEATQMSYDVKYIGMDVHKEAIVIAVQNESGKLVMESVVETKASSILQFLHGLGSAMATCVEPNSSQALSLAASTSYS